MIERRPDDPLLEGGIDETRECRATTRLALGFSLLLVLITLVVVSVLLVGIYWDRAEQSIDDGGAILDGDDVEYAETFVFPNAAVATDNSQCSQIGADVIAKGGNAADATVASVLCLGVLQQFASGIGGGGVALLRYPNGTVFHYDFRETGPANATENMFVKNPNAAIVGMVCCVLGNSYSTGGLSVGVPGEVIGLEKIYQRHGSGAIEWADLVAPAAELAASSIVSPLLAARLQENQEFIINFAGLRSVFAPEGELLKEGDVLNQPALSNTLTTIGEQGARGFYFGQVAENITADAQATGGILSMEDMEWYYENGVKEREALSNFYNGYEVIGAHPPFAGGVCNSLAMNILEAYNLPLLGSSSDVAQHWLVEAMKFAFSDRMAVGDPDFVANVNDYIIPNMLSKKHAAELRQKLNSSTTYPPEHYVDLTDELVDQLFDHGTSHMSVIDKDGMTIALTTTVNTAFGSKILSPGSGVILNDEMADFSSPNVSNVFGLPPAVANYPAAFKRPLSSMSPTIVLKDNELLMSVGASGGPTIITAVLQTMLAVLDYNMDIGQSISRPRVHNQLVTDTKVERDYSSEFVSSLRSRNHIVQISDDSIASVQGIVRLPDGTLSAASDWRKKGTPAGL